MNIPSAVPGSAEIASDGSTAMVVPARRALTWQTTDSAGEPVVRERYWLSFQAGEIRTCTACHGTNTQDQVGRSELLNAPLALKNFLSHWNQRYPEANSRLAPYTQWAEEMNLDAGAEASRQTDSDSDGLTQFEEFVYGDDPTKPLTEESIAKPLTTRIVKVNGRDHVGISFTHRTTNDVRIAVESSEDLAEWKEEVLVQGDGQPVGNGFEIETSGTSFDQQVARLQYVEVISMKPRELDPRRYYRLRVQE